MQQITLKIDGMHCSMCEAHINEIVRKNDLKLKVKSSHLKNETKIITDHQIDINEIKSNIEKDGYRVLNISTTEVKKTLFGYKEINK